MKKIGMLKYFIVAVTMSTIYTGCKKKDTTPATTTTSTTTTTDDTPQQEQSAKIKLQ